MASSRLLLGLALALSLAVSAGCPANLGTRPKAAAKVPARGGVQTMDIAEAPRRVDAGAVAVELTGRVKLISDKGLGIISNNTGSLISNNGGSLVSDKGGAIIGDQGSGLTARQKYALTATVASRESLLADAPIEVLDAAGRMLVDADGQPISATTDAKGTYRLKAKLPAENLILRIRLFNGGQLFAMLARDGRAGVTDRPIDTASSLGARYVLDRYVKQRQAIFDRLPASESDKLYSALDAAGDQLPATPPSYKPADLVALAETVRAKTQPVDLSLKSIEAILLAGQADLGNGLDATAVALATPTGVVGDAAGNLYIAEVTAFRIRKVTPEGKISVFVGTGSRSADGKTNQDLTLEAVGGLDIGPDGNLYVTQIITGQVRRITPAGAMSVVVGPLDGALSGTFGLGGSESDAPSAGLHKPNCLAFAPDGTMYVGEAPTNSGKVGRIFTVSTTGALTQVPCPEPFWENASISGLAIAPDETLYALENKNDRLLRKRKDGAWEIMAEGLATTSLSRIRVGPEGALFLSNTDAHQVLRFMPDGRREVFAGTGERGYAGDGGPATQALMNQPSGLWLAPDGRVYISDTDGVVRLVAPNGTIRTFAGTLGAIQGDALAIPINGPGGLALDAQNRLVIAESGSSTIKRLEAGALTVIAGSRSGSGFSGDGGPAQAAQFAGPSGIGYAGDNLYVIDGANHRIRKIDGQGTVTTVVQRVTMKKVTATRFPALATPMEQPVCLAIGPGGLPYWTDAKAHVIMRLTAEGDTEIIAGTYEQAGDEGDVGPAAAAQLNTPFGLAFDSKADLYFCDALHQRVRKITLSDPSHPISLVAGLTPDKFIAGMFAGSEVTDVWSRDGGSAVDAMLLGPVGLAFDADDNLFVSEMGTAKLTSFGGASGVPAELLQQLPKVGSRIRRIAKDGTIHAVAGDGTRVLNDPASDQSLIYPFLVLVDRDGRLIVGDSATNQIKMLPKGSY